MTDPGIEQMTHVKEADAASAEPHALEHVKPSVERALSGDEVRDDEVEDPSGGGGPQGEGGERTSGVTGM